jgi:hypothetical protein
MKKNKERDKKLYYQLYIDITFNYFNCKKTLISNSKVKAKSKPYTIYVTCLESLIKLSSDQEIKDIYQDNEDDDLEAS